MFNREFPILGYKDFFIMEQMTMLNGLYWYSGQGLANLEWAWHFIRHLF